MRAAQQLTYLISQLFVFQAALEGGVFHQPQLSNLVAHSVGDNSRHQIASDMGARAVALAGGSNWMLGGHRWLPAEVERQKQA